LVLPKGSRSGTFQTDQLGTRGQRWGGWGEIKKKKGIFGERIGSHGKVGADWDTSFLFSVGKKISFADGHLSQRPRPSRWDSRAVTWKKKNSATTTVAVLSQNKKADVY
jgi:hypothetical protein